MASWCRPAGRTTQLGPHRSAAALLPAPSAARTAARTPSRPTVSSAARPQVNAVAAPPAPTEKAPGKDVQGPVILNGQTLHSLGANRLEMINSISGYVEERVLPVLKDVDKCWQPADLLPDPASDTFLDEVRELRVRTECLPDDYWVVLAGDMITEEALPTYMAMLNTLDGVRDETGAAPTPWGRWTRAWTAEENRHGDTMNKYMYLSGKVNMKAIEVTIQNLIGSGMDPKTENNPYLGFVYTSFQERATKISHGNTARHAKDYGDGVLGKICGHIASDEGRHEIAYSRIVEKFFELDPSGTMCAFEEMMRKQIVMPAHLMNDMQHRDRTGRALFSDFSSVAQATKTYTAGDYADIIDHLVKHWCISEVTGLSEEGVKAQEYVGKLSTRVRRLAERAEGVKQKKAVKATPFSWIYDRPVDLRPTP